MVQLLQHIFEGLRGLLVFQIVTPRCINSRVHVRCDKVTNGCLGTSNAPQVGNVGAVICGFELVPAEGRNRRNNLPCTGWRRLVFLRPRLGRSGTNGGVFNRVPRTEQPENKARQEEINRYGCSQNFFHYSWSGITSDCQGRKDRRGHLSAPSL